MDRADEIARDLWERVWDWERKEGIEDIAAALREFATEAVKADRKRIAETLKQFSPGDVAAKLLELHIRFQRDDHSQR